MNKYKIYKNTDSLDIQQKCIGLSIHSERDPELNTDRGLHVQIRHNENVFAFKAASEIAALFAASPRLLEALKNQMLTCVCGEGEPKCPTCEESLAIISEVERK